MSLESKVELLSLLTASLKEGIINKKVTVDKENLFKELFGAWADMDDDITEIIYSSRTTSDREIDFD